jgi:hypothetical protein
MCCFFRAAEQNPVLATARKITRAQMRGMATMAATTASSTVRDSQIVVTPASALVEMGGSGRVHKEEAEGSSTLQSVFNTVNLLLGLGLLSLPYAMRVSHFKPEACVLLFCFYDEYLQSFLLL